MALQETLLQFGAKFILAAGEQLIVLTSPGESYTAWYNDTDNYVDVETFDEKDAVRWIRYEERRIAPKQAVRLTARGRYIHVRVKQNRATYDCDKNQSYLFDGQNVHSKGG